MSKLFLDTPAGRYRWHENWALIPISAENPENGRTHGVVVDKNGRIYVFRQAIPAMLVFEPDGSFAASWGNYPGAHGLTLVEEQGQEHLWLTDQERAVAEKGTLDGDLILRLDSPPYAAFEPYVPTWVAVNEVRYGGNGDIWVADGYGSHRVSRFDAAGKFTLALDGTEGCGRFSCPHGIWFDRRKRPMELYIADRGNRRVQVYDEQGHYLRSFGENFLTSPDGFALDGDRLIVPELHGRVTLLDTNDRLICHLGANETVCDDPLWPDGNALLPCMFSSPHAAAADARGNLYVVEWRRGGRIVKLERCQQEER
jgi:hypothetical protein